MSAASKSAKQQESRPKPVHEIRMGKVKAAIWANETESGAVRHNVTFSRIYKEGAEWKTSTSFGRDELPLVVKVADLAHDWIYQHGSDGGEPTGTR